MDSEISQLKGNRNFILSRNTFGTTGRFASHWLGNNQASWSDMKYSVSNIMNFNMFGTPLTGPDTCGYFG
jgi:alpha-glucosidase (family GH31 glycosyl hydrolase)